MGLLRFVFPSRVSGRAGFARAGGYVFALALVAASTCASLAFAQVALDADTGESRIVNGSPTFDYSSVGMLLAGGSPSNSQMVCSGTLIGCRTFLTAAHCVCGSTGAQCQPPNDPSPAGIHVFIPHAGFLPVQKIFVHPDYQFLSRFSHADLAIIQLGVSVSGVGSMPIAQTATPVGTDAEIVGFGRSGGGTKNDDYGIKRQGIVTTDDCNTSNPSGLICWNFFGPGSNTCNGDSGGPLFADLGGGQVLAGVTSGGASSTCLPNDHSFDTDVGAYHSWIESTVSYEILGAATCGAGSQIGDANNLEDGAGGSLAGCHFSSVDEFVIGTGSTQLRLSLNAKDNGDADFDMFVKRGSPPTVNGLGQCTDCDCKQDDIGQFGFCQFANPGGGRWYVRTQRFSGGGEYQITLNNRNTQPAVCGNALREPGEDCDGASDDDNCPGLCEPGCTCPTPVCGNSVTEIGEDCDVGMDSACPGRCNAQCTCDCVENDLEIWKLKADEKRLFMKAVVDGSGGEYADFNPSDGFRLYLDDGAVVIPIEIPAGDSGWEYSDCAKRRFTWKGDIGGIKYVSVSDRTSTHGLIYIKIKGSAVANSLALVETAVSVVAHLDETCTTGSVF